MRPARCAAIINAPSARGSWGVGSDVSDSACQMSSVVKSKVLVAICLMMSIVAAAQVGSVLVATCVIALSRASVAVVILVYPLWSWFVFGGCLRMSVVQTVLCRW